MLCWVEELCGEEEHDVSDLSEESLFVLEKREK